MSHRAHLFSLRIGHAFRESCFAEPYTGGRFRKDLLAGLTVGIIAIPLAMALAIASGVPPQYGLYTAAIAGFVIALTGGSRFSISGPTAAFVVILYPITQKYGLSGLLLASVMAGMMLVVMALFRLGRLIEYIPEPVTLGFTGGIGVVIATLQIKDFLGLPIESMPEHYVEKIIVLAEFLGEIHWPSVLVAGVTLATMLLWPRLKNPIPAHLPAVVVGSLVALGLNNAGLDVDTIYSRFSYIAADGSTAQGIPPILPAFQWPWLQPGADGLPLVISWSLMRDLLPAAFAIAMLGAIESLLCAVVLDGMTGKRHSANSELLGQGIGNIVTPFFGGITATAAIARSAANVKAGAESPVAGAIHAIVVVLGLVSFARILGYLPMPAMAALLMVVAWNMSEAPKSMHMLKTSQRSDMLIFLTCFSLTVLFDMVVAITAGIVLAAILFMKEIADMTRVVEITRNKQYLQTEVPEKYRVFKITGPLFFAAADKIFSELTRYCERDRGIILYLDNVTLLDAGGLSSLTKLIAHCQRVGAQLSLTNVQFQPLKTMKKAGIEPVEGVFRLYPTLADAL
ncbi:C4-dicarboxylic acid transporter DauA [Gammaproteobacteria bacterium LSUCC0112]|nr:C4-dicarboxylic acid transporter DauA [Gammaproteobacteria bacterium LSUCC0112]